MSSRGRAARTHPRPYEMRGGPEQMRVGRPFKFGCQLHLLGLSCLTVEEQASHLLPSQRRRAHSTPVLATWDIRSEKRQF